MRVVIDGLSYFLNDLELGQYTRRLINNLNPNKDDAISLIRDKEIITTRTPCNNIEVKQLYINRTNKNYRSVENIINNVNIDIYHCPNNGFSLPDNEKYNCKVVTTIHNIIPKEYERYYNSKYLRKYYNAMQGWDKFTDKIICPSTYLKEVLESKFLIDREKIKVILPVTDKVYTKQSKYLSKVYLKSKFNFEGDFILYSGELHKRKRLEDFLQIFMELSKNYKDLYFIMLAKISNGNYQYYKELSLLIAKMGLSRQVKIITSLNKYDKLNFYNATKYVVDFSVYEGFNISLLEARNCGTNIICSDIQTYKELLGDSPMYLDIDFPFINDILEEYLEIDERFIDNRNEDKNNNELYELYDSLL